MGRCPGPEDEGRQEAHSAPERRLAQRPHAASKVGVGGRGSLVDESFRWWVGERQLDHTI